MRLLAVILLMCTSFININAQNGLEILQKMIDESSKINTLQFYTIIKERCHGELQLQKSLLKVQNSPFKVYYRQDYPSKGIEILFVDGKNSNKALVKPNSFPWVNLNLDPLNSLLRVKQHHTLYHPGFAYLIKVIKKIIENNIENIESHIEYKGEISWNNISCYELSMSNPNFKYLNYTVKANETIDDIADKFFISSYMIYELNKEAQSYTDIKEGQIIIIPNTYAKSMTIYIDKKRNIPLVLKIYDDKGLYEWYEFYDVEINKEFKPEEFSPSYKDYKF